MAIPAKCVTVEEARTLQDNWKKTREPEINRAIGSIDTREFFYSVAELEEYLTYVKEESKKQGITNPGVRIYFGAYNNDITNKACVFIAPTNGSSKESENNYTVAPFNHGLGGWPPINY
ncbi:MAG: hypothetical protein CVU03_04020 [Bacteroidetes bacterium HGW-Bacteroidetes-2]|jgi:hypothetical protein|nr:MAG: hypothetical protein CVU03_04020 [Bacteroidetes bacterium HGW-Bacteroidetes-2]